MPHSYTSSLFHIVFSTKERRQTIHADFRPRLWAYLGGIAKENRMKALAVGGTDDHLHAMLSLPATMSVSKCVQLIKGGSSLWVHQTFSEYNDFAWQEGFSAFSIGVSQIEPTRLYIAYQEEHHRRKTFQEEFLEFLHKHDIEYDPRYIWG